ncbi:unnamed protein product [Adineta ricciae]|uniref:Uncharacterized protein n=1 Tax=Adineta ricciae TaxID=249248 RepID=A0A815BDZ7_ADIRI|nr:unnamed protein product [Adineta ricciae]
MKTKLSPQSSCGQDYAIAAGSADAGDGVPGNSSTHVNLAYFISLHITNRNSLQMTLFIYLIILVIELSPVFLTFNDNIYFEKRYEPSLTDKFPKNSTACHKSLKLLSYVLFVDIRNTFYCSVFWEHRVLDISLPSNNRSAIRITGTGVPGSGSYQADHRRGIFVDINFNLYVADRVINRIQSFRHEQFNEITMAGNNIPTGLRLNLPMDVILDGNEFLYIADTDNHRVIHTSN